MIGTGWSVSVVKFECLDNTLIDNDISYGGSPKHKWNQKLCEYYPNYCNIT